MPGRSPDRPGPWGREPGLMCTPSRPFPPELAATLAAADARSGEALEEYSRRSAQHDEMRSRLQSMPCGRTHWSAYQKLCADILRYLFHPPLEQPLYENPNATGVNRRDIVLPNYATSGFWQFLREEYQADFIVIDTKNNCGGITKPHVLQIANYLSEPGAGLFGVILTRRDEDRAAFATRREQWINHRKMVLVVGDVDLIQMMDSKASGGSAEEVLLKKLEGFRLGI
jgi:hypothetical protein